MTDGEWRVVEVWPDPLLHCDEYEVVFVRVDDPTGQKWGGRFYMSRELLADPHMDFAEFFIAAAKRAAAKRG